jgi:hypothetical protein
MVAAVGFEPTPPKRLVTQTQLQASFQLIQISFLGSTQEYFSLDSKAEIFQPVRKHYLTFETFLRASITRTSKIVIFNHSFFLSFFF